MGHMGRKPQLLMLIRKPARRPLKSACIVAALLAAIVLVVPGPPPALPAEPTRNIEVLWTTPGPEENPFRMVDGIAGAPDGRIFMVDSQAHSLYRFDPQTRAYVWLDQRGQGPGELESPYLVTLTHNGEVAVYDMGRRKVLIYSTDLEPLREIQLRRFITNPKGFAFLSDGTFIITGSFPSAAVRGADIFAAHRFAEDGAVVARYVRLPDPGQPQWRNNLVHIAGGPVFSLAGGGFLYSNSAPHRILRFDASFNETEIVADPQVVPEIVETFATERYHEERKTMYWELDWYHDQSRGIYELSDGRLLNIITRRGAGTSTWELYGAGGRLLERFEANMAYHPFGITQPDDVVLARYQDSETSEYFVAALRWKQDR